MLSAEGRESKPETAPQCWEALNCALANLLIPQVFTVHERHVEPDSVRQLDALLPSRLLRKFHTELLWTACESALQAVTQRIGALHP